MSTRSYPSGFNRPPREVPVFDRAEHVAMMARLSRRCAEVEARKISGTPSASGDQTVSAPHEKTPSPGGESQFGPIVQPALPQLSRPAPPDGPQNASIPTQERRSPLRWANPQGDGRRTLCDRYAVARIKVNGVTRYELRRRLPNGVFDMPVGWGDFPSFLSASEAAQQHADGVL